MRYCVNSLVQDFMCTEVDLVTYNWMKMPVGHFANLAINTKIKSVYYLLKYNDENSVDTDKHMRWRS